MWLCGEGVGGIQSMSQNCNEILKGFLSWCYIITKDNLLLRGVNVQTRTVDHFRYLKQKSILSKIVSVIVVYWKLTRVTFHPALKKLVTQCPQLLYKTRHDELVRVSLLLVHHDLPSYTGNLLHHGSPLSRCPPHTQQAP